MAQLAYISLGSNLDSPAGSPQDTLAAACNQLRTLAVGELRASNLHRTRPVGCEPGTPDFLNAAAVFEPRQQDPFKLLAQLQGLEQQFGRSQSRRSRAGLYTARPLDLDIIALGNLSLQHASLTVPHPRAEQREFVLAPLSEIAPDLVLPGHHLSVLQLLQRLRADG
jgi:2-amino-4-hydroxy-6-hydroxymethyldihydropteridine diphosphokinase